jgi:endonuclease/exonuclease/phosphatase family metal-dependent hydrolase
MKLRLGTFNLFQFVEPPYSWYTKSENFTQAQWLTKTSWIKKQIIKMDCEIIGFQEVFSKDALECLVKDLGFSYFETLEVPKLCNTQKNTYVSTTVAIASKYPITSIKAVKIHIPSFKKHNLVGAFKFSRIPIKATIKLPNEQEIIVYVCHLKSNRLNEFEYKFNAEHSMVHKTELIRKIMKENDTPSLKLRLCEASSLFYDIKNEKDKAAVLMCDLNDKEFSLTIDALTNKQYHDDQSQKELVLHDASYQYKEIIYNPHPEQKEPTRKHTSYFEGRGNVLDYIFISNTLNKEDKNKIANVSAYTILDDHLQENQNGSLLQSDHAQVVCELTFI